METNLEQQSPKLNVTNVSFGKEEGATSDKKSNGATLGKESSIGKLSRILRTTRLKVNEVEKSITGISAKFLEIDKKITLNTENITGNTKKTETNAEKITRLKKILQNQKSNIGEKLPGSTEEKEKAKLNTTLTETNRILVEIQKQLAYDFAMRAAEDKQEVAEDKEATSKERFKREESALEKSAKAMVSTVKTATKKIVSPIGNIFDKLIAFIGILGQGILVNAAFEWFKDPENQKKITKFFNILKQNWKLIRNILGVIAGVIIGGKIIALGSAIAALAGPLTILAAAAGLVLATASPTAKFDQVEGENAVYNDPRLGKGESFEIEQPAWDFLGVFTNMANTQEKKEDRARLQIQLLEGSFNEMDVKEWSADAQKKYNDAIKFLKLDKEKLAERLKPFRDYREARGRFDRGEGPSPGNSIFYTPLPENLDGLRAMGGPVTAGKHYLVGEGGPEIFAPNINGSVINNMRTEKITQMLASGKKSRTRIVELPPQTIEGPKPQIKSTSTEATKAPKILSFNSLDGYRNVSSEIYGIMV